MPTPTHIAALDIGTNSVVLLLLRRAADGTLHRVLEPARITRLGEEVAQTGVLKPQAVTRTLDAVAELLCELRQHAPGCVGVAAATSAVRDAANGPEFLDRCAEFLGGRPRLFSGHEEAGTMFLGATSDLAAGTPCLCVDIGGGSTELAAGTPGHCAFRSSVNLGCVRLGEAHHLFSQATSANIVAARHAAASLLREAWRGAAVPGSPLTVLATGGTATTFAAMAAGVAPFDPGLIHGRRFTAVCIDDWAERLLPLTPEERARHPGLSPDRAPVLPAGLLILAELLRLLGAPEAAVTTRGLRHGMCLRLLAGELPPTWGRAP